MLQFSCRTEIRTARICMLVDIKMDFVHMVMLRYWGTLRAYRRRVHRFALMLVYVGSLPPQLTPLP